MAEGIDKRPAEWRRDRGRGIQPRWWHSVWRSKPIISSTQCPKSLVHFYKATFYIKDFSTYNNIAGLTVTMDIFFKAI